MFLFYSCINPAQRKHGRLLNSAGSRAWLSEHSFKTKYLEGILFPMLLSSRQFVLNGHFSTTIKSCPADRINLKSEIKSNSPNTSLTVVFYSNFQSPYYSKPELVSPTAPFRKRLYFFLKFEIKMKRHKEKTYKVIFF